MTTTTDQKLTNQFPVIARIQWGWSASQITAAIELPPTKAERLRWFDALGGAMVAYESVNHFSYASTARDVRDWIGDNITDAKECTDGYRST